MADKDEFLFIPIEILKEIPYNMRCNKGKKPKLGGITIV